jgi:SAM-dependent methyltransferase
MEHVEATTGVDVERPSQARIYDYLLGGSLNFAVDREAAHQLIAMVPDVPLIAQANRAFLRRAVGFLVGAGIRQFLDIGSGVPTRGNVHELAQRYAPESRVVYVDIDPVAVAHSRYILAGDDRSTAIQEDARRPDRILEHVKVQGLLDLTQPIAILMVSVLHFIADSDDPAGIVRRLRDAIAPGGYLALSHITSDGRPDGTVQDARLADTFAGPRSRNEVERFFTGLELVEPGLVTVGQWRPESPEKIDNDQVLGCLHVGVGRKT